MRFFPALSARLFCLAPFLIGAIATVAGGGVTPGEMVRVTGGTLPWMGFYVGEISTSDFYIGKYEVTWGEWQEVREWAADNGYDIGSRGAGCADNHPVHSVNWYDAVKWCNAKSQMEGFVPVYTQNGSVYKETEPPYTSPHTSISQDLSANGYRLPLEAEWEFAARGGNRTIRTLYSGSNDLNAVGWCWNNSSGAACNLYGGRGTWPVGQKAANELGLYDMSGNVWEWCWDPISFGRRIRGGSWQNYASGNGCTVWFRHAFNPFTRDISNGFRLVRSSETISSSDPWARPSGWMWAQGEWEWSNSGQFWYWIPPGPPYVQNMSTGRVVPRPINGWNFYDWPYFWDADQGVWYFIFQGNLPYVLNPETGQWRRWGE